MASASLQSLHRHLLLRHSRQTFFPSSTTSPSGPDTVVFIKPGLAGGTTTRTKPLPALSSSLTTPSTPAASPTPSPSPSSTSLDTLKLHLSAQDFRAADDETRRLLIALAGDAAVKRGYVFFSEVQFIPVESLRAVDELWREHSGGKYGYSVQRRLWEKVGRDFTRFFIRVGWMKKLEGTEVEQYGYRSFPTEFIWEMDKSVPEGHLPLTNALRGTQLLACVLAHPAFEGGDGEVSDSEVETQKQAPAVAKGAMKKPLTSDYSF